MSYWENRSVQQIYEAMKDTESIADQMSRTYMKASAWLNEQGRDIFERFRKKWDLSEEEARKLIEAAGNGATAQQLVQTYMATGGKDKALIREMESYAFRARMERLADISLQLDHIMHDVYQQEVKKTTAFYKTLANDQYYKTIFNLQKRAGYGFSFAHVSEKQIDRMLHMKWYGQNYSQRIWKNTRELTEDLKTEMMVSLIAGRTDRETAEIFNQKYGAGAIKSRRLIRTEAAWVSSQMVLAGYKDAKIKEYMYLATLDLRTSQMCRDMDGKIFPVEEYTIGKTAPPLHPWCRSTTIAVIHREWLADMKRTAKDANGKVILIPANMTYQEWYDTYIRDNPAGQAEEKKIKNRSADRQQHEKYRKILGDKVPESFVRFQDMKYNDTEKWEKVQLEYKDVQLQKKICSESYSKQIEEGKQGKHILGHNNYIEGRSYLTVDIKEVQNLVNKYAGTGKIQRDAQGRWNHKEIVNMQRNVGVYKDLKGNELPTGVVTIHYSQKGVHIVPAKPKEKQNGRNN